MKVLLMMMLCGNIYAELNCEDTEYVRINCNLKEIPKGLPTNITQLILAQNSIPLDDLNRNTLLSYPNLTQLDLSENNITSLPKGFFAGLVTLEILTLKNNSITSVEEMSFDGLENLQILDLSYNQLTQIPAQSLSPLHNLGSINLQNNKLTNLDINMTRTDLKAFLNITLSGNPWNCECSLMNLSLWLNDEKVILQNENNTLCAAPESMTTITIKALKTASVDIINCDNNSDILPVVNSTEPTSPYLYTVSNGTEVTPTKGNSWRFLVGVVIVGLVTSLLILAAIKFPRWYDYLLSYNHHRLKEEEPYTFEEEFNADFNMTSNEKNPDEDETVIVFEQTHSFVPEDDGFIEDKYIDERDMRVET